MSVQEQKLVKMNLCQFQISIVHRFTILPYQQDMGAMENGHFIKLNLRENLLLLKDVDVQ